MCKSDKYAPFLEIFFFFFEKLFKRSDCKVAELDREGRVLLQHCLLEGMVEQHYLLGKEVERGPLGQLPVKANLELLVHLM